MALSGRPPEDRAAAGQRNRGGSLMTVDLVDVQRCAYADSVQLMSATAVC